MNQGGFYLLREKIMSSEHKHKVLLTFRKESRVFLRNHAVQMFS